jgi:hypothetical protein
MERSELIERLVPLIPPPRAHQVRYHGILAPGASQRDRIVPGDAIEGSTDGAKRWSRKCSAPAAEESRGASPAPGMPSGTAARGANFETRPDDREVDRAKAEPPSHADPRDRARRMRWASLLQRVFEVDALRCPRCGSTMRLLAAIEDPRWARSRSGTSSPTNGRSRSRCPVDRRYGRARSCCSL